MERFRVDTTSRQIGSAVAASLVECSGCISEVLQFKCGAIFCFSQATAYHFKSSRSNLDRGDTCSLTDVAFDPKIIIGVTS
jgi:hypothetical protein